MRQATEDRHKRHLQVVELRDLGLSIEGIAEVLGVHKDTVYWHVRREQARRDRLANRGGEDDAGDQPTLGSLPYRGRDPADHDPIGNPKQGLKQ